MRVRPIFAWYDWWIGGYYDRKAKRLYVMVPFVGLVFGAAPAPERTGEGE